jgi:carbonic anhydrase
MTSRKCSFVMNFSCNFVIRYALELHMVHHEKRFETIAKAATEKNGVAVLGVLFHVAVDPNPMIENLLSNAGTIFQAVGRNQTYQEKLLLENLLPKNKAGFFRYEGSLTTPGCGEAVVWTVFEKSIPISMDQVILWLQIKCHTTAIFNCSKPLIHRLNASSRSKMIRDKN